MRRASILRPRSLENLSDSILSSGERVSGDPTASQDFRLNHSSSTQLRALQSELTPATPEGSEPS